MKKFKNIKVLSFVILLVVVQHLALASDDHVQSVTIENSIAKNSNIKTATAAAGIISEQLKVYGKTVNDPSQVSHIRARFPGIVKSVKVHIGDRVNVGDTLALVESNESLKSYPIIALMSGVVVAQHANPGEMALEQVLFTLADFEKIWAELQIFPGQLAHVKTGMKVHVSGVDETAESVIEHIIPSQDEKPYSIARVLINNQKHDWTTGLLVSGQVVTNEIQSSLVVTNKAIQLMENKAVVFIKLADTYTAHAVDIGRSDGQFTEILSGISLGDEYVSENSYLIKADIEKSGASHDH